MNALEIVDACFHKFASEHRAEAVEYAKQLISPSCEIEWSARRSGGGMNESAVLITTAGTVMEQCQFARHIRHVDGGSELYRYSVSPGEVVLLLYRSGSGKTETASELTGDERQFDTWDDAEKELGIPEGSLWEVF